MINETQKEYLYQVFVPELMVKKGMSEVSAKATIDYVIKESQDGEDDITKALLTTTGVGAGAGAITGLLRSVLAHSKSENLSDLLKDSLRRMLQYGAIGGTVGAGASVLAPDLSQAFGGSIYNKLFGKNANLKKKTIAIDLDGTILEYDGYKGDDVFGKPIEGAKEALDKLKDMYTIIIWTCRGNEERIKQELDNNLIPYDYINSNPEQPPGTSDKIFADAYIDDRGINFKGNWDEAIRELYGKLSE